MQAMARSVAVVASATSKRRSLKTKSKTELAIGLMGADAFTADCGHEGDGRGDGALLSGG